MNSAFRPLRSPRVFPAILRTSHQPGFIIRTMSATTNGATAPAKTGAPTKREVKILMIHGPSSLLLSQKHRNGP